MIKDKSELIVGKTIVLDIKHSIIYYTIKAIDCKYVYTESYNSRSVMPIGFYLNKREFYIEGYKHEKLINNSIKI